MTEFTLPASADKLVPHRETMLLLDELSEYRDGVMRAKAALAAAHPFVDEQERVEPVTLVEMLAQTAAALKGYEVGQSDQAPRIGYLAGIKQFEIKAGARVGEELQIEARETFALDEVAMIDGRVIRGEECLAAGILKVWAGTETEPPPAVPGADGCAAMPQRVGIQAHPRPAGSPIHRAILDSAVGCEVSGPDQQAAGEFCFDDSFPGFRGHFPGRPILPGVIILKAVLLTCECGLGRPVRLTEVVRAKFSGMVLPRQRMRVEVTPIPGDGGWEARAVVSRAGERVADFRLVLGVADD
jgi:3-hydroxymyristoyl/3-hydroxydecanoyl-(acyl carrier protein) dehydratase